MKSDPVLGGDLVLAKHEFDDAAFEDDGVHGSVLLVDDNDQPYIQLDVEPHHQVARLAANSPARLLVEERPLRVITPIDTEDVSVTLHDVRVNPLQPGVRIQNKAGRIGTLGLTGFHRTTGQPAILSNWHVMSNSEGRVGDPIYQPRTNQTVARLRNGALPSENPFGYDVDAAAATSTGARRMSNVPYGLGGRAVTRSDGAYRGQHLVKSGRTTEVTHGKVDSLYASLRINYGDRIERFRNQIRIKPYPPRPVPEISSGGDSGSAWLDYLTRRAIGLHFAGESTGPDLAFANPIAQAMEAVDFEITRTTDMGVVVHRFWFAQGGFNGRYDHWFKNDPAAIPGYTYEGPAFRWFDQPGPDRTVVYQWFSRIRFNHYYHLGTGDSFVPGTDYVRQNIAGYVSNGRLPGMVQLWIGYNERNLDHHLTTNLSELTTNGYGSITAYGFVYPV